MYYKKKVDKKNSQLLINKFINKNIKRKRTNKALNTISKFLIKKLKNNKNITNKYKKMESPREVKDIEMELVSFEQINDFVNQ